MLILSIKGTTGSKVGNKSTATNFNDDKSKSKNENKSAIGIPNHTGGNNGAIESPWGTLFLSKDKMSWDDAMASCAGIS
jgi:hypothetical protein